MTSAIGSEQPEATRSAFDSMAPSAPRSWLAIVETLRERHWAMLAAAVALAATVAAFDRLPIGVWVDDGHYVILARALVTGRGYRYLNLPGEPFATHFPPGYPALLAVLTRLAPEFPANVRVFAFVNALLTAVTCACMVIVGRRRFALPLPVAALAGATWSVAVPTLMLSTAVMSEPLFLAMLLPALLVAERAARDGGARVTIAAGVMIAGCTLVRSIGFAAFAAFVIVLATRRRWRELGLAIAVTGAAISPWLVWKRFHQTTLPAAWAGMYGDYGSWLKDGLSSHGIGLLFRVAAVNARDVVEAFAVYWSAGPGGGFRTVLAIVLLVVTCAGLAVGWRRAPVIAWTFVGYMAIVLVWPFHPQRFVWGIGALWIVFGCAAAWRAWEAIPSVAAFRSGRRLAAGGLAALALCLPIASAMAVRTRAWNRVPRSGAETMVPLLQWIVRNTPPDAVLAADGETVIYLYTGRRALPYIPFKATDRVGLMTADEAYGGLAEMLRLYHPHWVLALGAPALRVALHFTTHEGSPLRMTTVPKFGAVFEARDSTTTSIATGARPAQ